MMQPPRTTTLHEPSLRPYLELVRPPNLLTAGADVLAGFAVVAAYANVGVLPLLLLASITLYAGGVALNDAFDAKLDEIERPERPIPSGRATILATFALGTVLLALGVGCAFAANPSSGLLALMIAVVCVIYNSWAKHEPLLGPLSLGGCRALNFLLGISAAPLVVADSAWLAIIPLLYIAGITIASHGEVHGGTRPTLFFALSTTLLVVLLMLAVAGLQRGGLVALPFLALFALFVLPVLIQAYRKPEATLVRAAVGRGVLGIIALDATIAASFGGLLFGLFVAALLPAALILARTLAAT